MYGLLLPFVRFKVTSRKSTIFLLASIVILRPFNLNTWLTSCMFVFLFSISFGVVLQVARSSSRYRPTSFLNFQHLDAIKDTAPS